MNPLIHCYYGNGKGKTTAALGLALRAAGAGWRVLFCQFLKGNDTSELSVLKTVPGLTIHRPLKKYPFTRNMTEADRRGITAEHNRILSEIEEALKTEKVLKSEEILTSEEMLKNEGAAREYKENTVCGNDLTPAAASPLLVVLDEIGRTWTEELIDRSRVLSLLDSRRAEFVLTGRDRVEEFLSRADYITELRAEKHPYEKGIKARLGIEY